MIGAASMITAALAWRARDSVWLSQFRGAATLYMAITGVVFNLLLRDLTEHAADHRSRGSTRCCTWRSRS